MVKGLTVVYKDENGTEHVGVCKSEVSNDERIKIKLEDGTVKKVSIDRAFVCKQ